MARIVRGPRGAEPEAEPTAKRPKNTPPVPPKGTWGGGKTARTTFTREEVDLHLQFVEQLLRTPGSTIRQHVAACRQRFGFGQGRYVNLKKRVFAEWEQQAEQNRPGDKARFVFQIEQMLAHARGQTKVEADGSVTWVRPPNHAAVAKYGQLLASVLGLNAPIEVNVHHTVGAALVDVLANLTHAQIDEALEEYVETMRLAEEFRRLPGAAE